MWKNQLTKAAVELAFKCLKMINDQPETFTDYIGSTIIASSTSRIVRDLFIFAADSRQKLPSLKLS